VIFCLNELCRNFNSAVDSFGGDRWGTATLSWRARGGAQVGGKAFSLMNRRLLPVLRVVYQKKVGNWRSIDLLYGAAGLKHSGESMHAVGNEVSR
jgi:hypothetical protein